MKKWVAIFGMVSVIILFGIAAVSWAEEKTPPKDTAKPDAGLKLKQYKSGATEDKSTKDNEVTIIPSDRLKNLARIAPGIRVDNFRDSMPVVVPDTTVDYKILVMKPDPKIDYKIKIVGRSPRVLQQDIPKSQPKSNSLPEPEDKQKTNPDK
ncbi:MAG: hypothetical protein ACYC9O_03050 [Candidatus Latescibacterota bacterium]